jgi:hypothetical protein
MSNRRFVARVAQLAVAVSSIVVAACGARTGLDAPESPDSNDTRDTGVADSGVRTVADAVVDDTRPPIDSAVVVDSGVVVVDTGTPDTSVTDPLCRVPDGGGSDGGACTRTLLVGPLALSSPSCWTDSAVSEGEVGTLVYDCGGGAASATFGSRTFVGAVAAVDGSGDFLDLCIGTEFDWSDGCHWHSAQHLVGSIASGALSFGYAESPDPGEVGCASSCKASATVTVE